MDIVKKELGHEGVLAIKFQGGKLVVELTHAHASGTVKLLVEEDAGYFFDKLADAIPGVLDDAIIGMVKEAVKKL